jgi:hypothetical protein
MVSAQSGWSQPRGAGVARQFRGPVHEPDDAAQAQTFVQLFKAKYGDRHPRFVEVSWRDATFVAQREFKFLFVYLHAPEHQVCASACICVCAFRTCLVRCSSNASVRRRTRRASAATSCALLRWWSLSTTTLWRGQATSAARTPSWWGACPAVLPYAPRAHRLHALHIMHALSLGWCLQVRRAT